MAGSTAAAYAARMEDHMSQVATWLLRTLGNAVLAGVVVGGALALIGVASDEPRFVTIGFVTMPLLFGVVLAASKAPDPAQDQAPTVNRSAP